MKPKNKNSVFNNSALRIIGIPAFILLIPFIAMQFSSEVKWDETDFIVIGFLLVVAVGLVELAIKTTGKYRIYVIAAIIFGALWLYAELAVGLFTDWGS